MRHKQGTITSAKMTDTVTVTVHRSVFHPMYKKRFRMSKKFLADTNGMKDLGVGDTVQITECRPISKRKHFKVTEVIKRVPRVSEMVEEGELAGVMKSKESKKGTEGTEGTKGTNDPDSSSAQ